MKEHQAMYIWLFTALIGVLTLPIVGFHIYPATMLQVVYDAALTLSFAFGAWLSYTGE